MRTGMSEYFEIRPYDHMIMEREGMMYYIVVILPDSSIGGCLRAELPKASGHHSLVINPVRVKQ